MALNNSSFPDPFAFAKAQIDDTEDAPGLRCEVKTYEARYNSKGERLTLQVGTKRDLKEQKDRDHDSALVLTRFYDRDKELEYTELEIRSPHINAAIREVINEYPGINLHARKIVIRDLPKCFFHYRNELQAYGTTLDDPITVQHIVFALQYMIQVLQRELVSYYTLIDSPYTAPGLEFVNLWMAFRPGSLIYTQTNKIDRVLRLRTMDRCACTKPDCYRSKWVLCLDRINYNGTDFGLEQSYLHIRPFDGYKRLEDLHCFPLDYHFNKHKIVTSLVARGRKFISLRGAHHRYYDGIAESLSSLRRQDIFGEEDRFPLQSIPIKGRIMVDCKTFGVARPSHEAYLVERHLIKTETNDHLKLSDDDLLICHHQMPGFALVDKRWCYFEVDDIQEISYNSNAFKALILPQDQKEMIRSLVNVHVDKRLHFDDVIRGKGKGVIFLLHGVPGVGKTLTAESVADYSQKPLYVVNCGDLGVDVNSIEENLSTITRLATSWNAIVLIDEADVFLEQRTAHDLKRNALVSIFLRMLEYYEGIMFLTTNRISAFDAAFKSRIHIAIKYHSLSVANRRELWKTFIAQGSPKNSNLNWINNDNEYLDRLATVDLNGRQIKNTVRTGHALAVSEGIDLAAQHLDMALKVTKTFDVDLLRPMTDEEEQNDPQVSEYRVKRRRQE